MSLTLCNVHFSRQADRVVYLTPPLSKALKLAGKNTVRFKLGQGVIAAAVKTIKRQGHHMYLSAGVRQSIRIPKTGNVYLLSTGNEVQLGPLIGILTDSDLKSSSAPFGSRTGFIRQLIRLGEKKRISSRLRPATLIGRRKR
ncbi:hypothetical protein PACILC2_46120 [Paenibacillus cisolokensis]|uniref:PTS EIIA type-1 domain-containing protein n=1 Tax=Paenibacillus cisolokensis TaxID=1658519 RepID=A0ABQ4NCU7_9BACL|nr:hypothetical protein PACILC2_46120 [Paenibacillus cisolokensis]